MPKFGFCGAFYTPKSLIADSQRLVNMYPEVIQSGLGRDGTVVYLIGTPGLKTKYTIPVGPARAQFTVAHLYPGQDRSFVIGGGKFYELLDSPNVVERGTMVSDGLPAYIASNKHQLAIATGKQLFIFDLETNTFTGPIVDSVGNLVQPLSVVYNNGFFLANTVDGTGQIQYSAPFDGLTWDPLDEFDAEASPDNTIRLLTPHNEVWAFGESTVQPFQVSGDPNNPFAPVQSGVINLGIAAMDSAAIMDNSPIWLGVDPERGGYAFWMAEGYTPTRVSNPAIDNILSGYSKAGIATSRAFVFGDEGHTVYQISFPDPSINATWRYDRTLPPELAWYEVGCWNGVTGQFEAHHSITHSFAFGMHLVGDRGGTCCNAAEVPPVPVTLGCPTAEANVGSPYSATCPATGGTGVYTFTIIDGALPDGLSINETTGDITGTPTTETTYSFTTLLQDSNGAMITSTCSIDVGPSLCSSITAPAILDLGDVEIMNSPTSYTGAVGVPIDVTDYPGMTSARFRTRVALAVAATGTIKLLDESSTVIFTQAITTGETVIDSAITLTGSHSYFVHLEHVSAVSSKIQAFVPQIWIYQTDANRSKYQVPLMIANDINNSGYFGVSSGTYVSLNNSPPGGIFRKSTAQFGPIDHWDVMVVLEPSTAAGKIALFNRTSNMMVAGTEYSHGAGAGTSIIPISNSATNFTDGDDFEFRALSNDGVSFVFYIYGALFVTVDGCITEVQPMERVTIMDCEVISGDRAIQYHASDWPLGTTFTFYGTRLSAGTQDLVDVDTSTTIATNTFGAGRSYQETSGITLIDGHWYTAGVDNTAGIFANILGH